MAQLPEVMSGRELEAFEERRDALVQQDVPEELAARVAVLPPAYMLLGIIEVARRDDLDTLEVARLHFALGERLGLPLLVGRILRAAARRPLADDGPRGAARRPARRALPADRAGAGGDLGRGVGPGADRAWEDGDSVVVSRAAGTLEEICGDDGADLARLSVGLRVVRGLLATG